LANDYLQKPQKPRNTPTSKHITSSIIAAITDPSGISPTVVYKIFLQKLWLHELEWEDPTSIRTFVETVDRHI
jgi:hypothetical protein